MTFRYARRMERVKPSIIREFARLAGRPEIISFAGGVPAAELFPIEELKDIAGRTHCQGHEDTGRGVEESMKRR